MSEKEHYTIVYRQAGEGCDHTIGCGVRIERFTGWWSEVLPHAEQEVADMSTDEQTIVSAEIYRGPPAVSLDVALIRAKALAMRGAQKQTEERERAEYERLRRKFEGRP